MFSATDRSPPSSVYGYGYKHTYRYIHVRTEHSVPYIQLHYLVVVRMQYTYTFAAIKKGSLGEKQKNAASLHRRFHYFLLSTGLEPTAGNLVLPSTALPTHKKLSLRLPRG